MKWGGGGGIQQTLLLPTPVLKKQHLSSVYPCNIVQAVLILNAPIATKVLCFSRLLQCLSSLYGKQCGPRSECSYRSSLSWVYAVCFYDKFVSNVRQFFCSRRLQQTTFSDAFFLGASRANTSESGDLSGYNESTSIRQ